MPLANSKAGHVFLVTSGEYENFDVFAIASDLESAISYIKAVFAQPYIVAWSPLMSNGRETWTLTGKFERVIGYSTEHVGTYWISREPVRDGHVALQKRTKRKLSKDDRSEKAQ